MTSLRVKLLTKQFKGKKVAALASNEGETILADKVKIEFEQDELTSNVEHVYRSSNSRKGLHYDGDRS